jgi:hypothetical protein
MAPGNALSLAADAKLLCLLNQLRQIPLALAKTQREGRVTI